MIKTKCRLPCCVYLSFLFSIPYWICLCYLPAYTVTHFWICLCYLPPIPSRIFGYGKSLVPPLLLVDRYSPHTCTSIPPPILPGWLILSGISSLSVSTTASPASTTTATTTRLAREVVRALASDPMYGPLHDKNRHCIGIEYEALLEQSLMDMGTWKIEKEYINVESVFCCVPQKKVLCIPIPALYQKLTKTWSCFPTVAMFDIVFWFVHVSLINIFGLYLFCRFWDGWTTKRTFLNSSFWAVHSVLLLSFSPNLKLLWIYQIFPLRRNLNYENEDLVGHQMYYYCVLLEFNYLEVMNGKWYVGLTPRCVPVGFAPW